MNYSQKRIDLRFFEETVRAINKCPSVDLTSHMREYYDANTHRPGPGTCQLAPPASSAVAGFSFHASSASTALTATTSGSDESRVKPEHPCTKAEQPSSTFGSSSSTAGHSTFLFGGRGFDHTLAQESKSQSMSAKGSGFSFGAGDFTSGQQPSVPTFDAKTHRPAPGTYELAPPPSFGAAGFSFDERRAKPELSLTKVEQPSTVTYGSSPPKPVSTPHGSTDLAAVASASGTHQSNPGPANRSLHFCSKAARKESTRSPPDMASPADKVIGLFNQNAKTEAIKASNEAVRLGILGTVLGQNQSPSPTAQEHAYESDNGSYMEAYESDEEMDEEDY